MNKTGFNDFTDLLIIFFLGLALSFSTHFIFPLPIIAQIIFVSLALFHMARSIQNYSVIVEWSLFFAIGVMLAPLIPNLIEGKLSLNLALKQVFGLLPYLGSLFSAWIAAIPLGLVFSKTSQRKYYRNPRFF